MHFPNETFFPWERQSGAGELLIGLHRALTVAAARPDVNAAGYSLKQKRNTTAFSLRAGGVGGRARRDGGGRAAVVGGEIPHESKQADMTVYLLEDS